MFGVTSLKLGRLNIQNISDLSSLLSTHLNVRVLTLIDVYWLGAHSTRTSVSSVINPFKKHCDQSQLEEELPPAKHLSLSTSLTHWKGKGGRPPPMKVPTST